MNEGVEWALHSCVNLGWLEDDQPVTTARLAAFYDLPPAYLNKQLQALVRAGLLTSTSGPRGGFRLARKPEDITVLDVVTAIEGREDAFRCEEILRKGPNANPEADYRRTCRISVVMRKAELAWRRELAGQTIADVQHHVEKANPEAPGNTRAWFVNARP
ncbi:RrF2 family transcriptional regulator [Nonomuraea sp. NPDC050556]|uniref:RrF2 family transcriptional regulator n=1 Tax=Nonomuraea sp. NPDC050556 TaxID=3364369 RepID=UPI003795AD28